MENEQIEKDFKVFIEAQEKAEIINTNENELEKSFESSDNSNYSENQEEEENNESSNNHPEINFAEKENLDQKKLYNLIDDSNKNINDSGTIINKKNHDDVKTLGSSENISNPEEIKVNLEQNYKHEGKKNESKSIIFNPDEFVIMMTIGRGNFSEVFLVENVNTKILYAMKQFLKQRIEQLKKQEEVLMEKHVMNKITPHENIIGFGGSYRDSVIILFVSKLKRKDKNHFY